MSPTILLNLALAMRAKENWSSAPPGWRAGICWIRYLGIRRLAEELRTVAAAEKKEAMLAKGNGGIVGLVVRQG